MTAASQWPEAAREASPPAGTAPFSRVDLMGVPVAQISTAEFCNWLIGELLAARAGDGSPKPQPKFITYLNAACSNIAANDSEYRKILRHADCVYADGQAIVWAAGWLGRPIPERVNAGDFIAQFCEKLASSGLRIGLVGGRPGVAASAAAAWLRHAPSLNIAGAWDGFFTDGGAAVCARIRESQVDLLLVGMGVPLQEKWAWGNRDNFAVSAVWCVGALFEYYGEGRARAPVWMRRVGLEWAFRLVLEPRRLWRRYLVGNVRFVRRVLRARHGTRPKNA